MDGYLIISDFNTNCSYNSWFIDE